MTVPDTPYRYVQALTEDILAQLCHMDLREYSERAEAEADLPSVFRELDTVTGNPSGSYTRNTEQAREYLRGNEGLLAEILETDGLGTEIDAIKRIIDDPEGCDVLIRCYLLDQCVTYALDVWEQVMDKRGECPWTPVDRWEDSI